MRDGSQKMLQSTGAPHRVHLRIQRLSILLESQTLISFKCRFQWCILVIMFAEEKFVPFGSTQETPKETSQDIRGRQTLKEKKICKPVERNAERHLKGKEWTRVEKLCYARLLLASILHSISIGTQFFDYVAQELSRKPQEIYAFHRKMISEFRTKRSIVKELLGLEYEAKKPQGPTQRPSGFPKKPQATHKHCPMIDTSSSDELKNIQLGSPWLMVEKGPEDMTQYWEDSMEIQQCNMVWDDQFENEDPSDSFEAYGPYQWSIENHGMSL